MSSRLKSWGAAIGTAALAAVTLPGSAPAETYPDKPITIVVSASVGGSVDALTRQLAPFWEKTLGQRINVENKEGAGGITGVRYFLEQPDDGYTILVCTEAHFTATAEKYSDIVKPADIELINMQQFDPTSFTVLETSPIKSIDDLVKAAKEKPDSITWGSPPTGSAALVGKLVDRNWNLGLRFVPQDGGAATDTALLGGHIDVKVGTAAGDVSELKGIRVLAVSAPERLSFLPDVPTFNEAGEKLGFKDQIPNLGTARLVVTHASMKAKHPEFFQKLAESYKAAFNDPEYQKVLESTGQALATSFHEPDEATSMFRDLVANSIKYRKEFGS